MDHGISRQTFLRGAVSALAAGAVFGTARGGADPGAAAASWNGLASTIGGSVLLPASGAQFASRKQVFNSFYNGATPAAIVAVSSQADVQKALAFASANKLKVAPRGGGHSYVGASSANGVMVLDLRGLPGGPTLDGGNVTATPATNLWAIHQTCAGAGRGVPTGSCPTVGVGGLTLGGGLGADSRHAGLACDALQSATVVLPSGDVVTASANDHPDLFWALRGGGGGNVGVTTSMTMATFPTGDTDIVRLDFAPSSAVQVLVGWQNWLNGADRNAWAMVDLAVGGTQPDCHILATCPAGGAAGMADAIKAAIGLQPTAVTNKTMNRMDLVTYLAGGSSTSPPRGFVAGSDVITTVNSAAAHAIATAIGQWPASAGQASLLVDPLGGAIADVAPGDTAFPWRKQSAVLQWYVEPAANQVSAATQWLSSAHQAVQQFSVGGYVNYLEPNTAASRYFGSNLAQLNSVRQKYDPNQIMFSGLKF
ncbi:FAD-dependent oxidoreductase [Mycobacterium sherrisii]|uniref:Oxidoreductase n=1 Tax=Mycobacterium sherrisii TaxID=243061 RepID=A0A1E3T4D4_9MYCO|nr:FAD-binding oxidoreductase [Mycobacterium sherrisii]MCV7030183.1 FAD-binding oxidoreductase [Mycobacterium sherrisii]MEC4765354.1 FAD-binding oxidoreductase [Mycobacterium sherrisii]ODR09289.1 oxidoreductase [Mycobacterium sherrisii]ORW74287.1 oxidoreductase [Mycobacterium sherrisii]